MPRPVTVARLAERRLVTRFGTWTEYLYYDGRQEAATLVYGDIAGGTDVLCRIHSACLSAHVFNSIECDCRDQMELAQSAIVEAGAGVVIWLDQDGRGNGHLALMLAARMAEERQIAQTTAYELLGYPSDPRSYGAAAGILNDLDVRSIVLLSDSPTKAKALVDFDVVVTATRSISLSLEAFPRLRRYYADKRARGYTLAPPPREAGEE